MTTRHVIDFYMDGYVPISFCKVCSAEGDKLFEDCPGKITDKNKNTLDEKKQTAK